MYVAGRSRACPNPRFNMGALIDMLKGYGLQVQDIEAGGKYRDGRQALRQQSVDVATAGKVIKPGELRHAVAAAAGRHGP
jgi:hypothetical protein